MEGIPNNRIVSTSHPCHHKFIVARPTRGRPAPSTRVQSLDDQAEQLASSLGKTKVKTSSIPKYSDVLKSHDAVELSNIIPNDTDNLFQDEDWTKTYDGMVPGDEQLFNGPLSPNPIDSDYYSGDVNSYRNMDKGGSGGPRRGFMSPTTGLGTGPIDPLGVPRILSPEETALESYRVEKAINNAMATHHAIQENAHNLYAVTVRLGEILEALDLQDVAQPAPRLPGTSAKVPGWIRAEKSILEDLPQLNELQMLIDEQHNELELKRREDAIAEEVDAAIKLLADTNPQAGVTYEAGLDDDDDIMDDLLQGLLPGTAEPKADELQQAYLRDILPGAGESYNPISGLGLDLDDLDTPSVSASSKSVKGKKGASSSSKQSDDEDVNVDDIVSSSVDEDSDGSSGTEEEDDVV